MKKLFSLLFGNAVHLQAGVKRIPAEEFSKLQNATELLATIQEEEKTFQIDLEKAAKARKAAGFKKGFEEGLTSLNTHIMTLDRELKTLREDVQKKILPLALKAAKKLLGEELRLHPERIVEIVLTSLKPVTQHKKIIIFVNKQDLVMLEKERPRIRAIFEHLESLSLQERDDIEPGGCMIETEAGIINAQLETQWRTLEAAFDSFMAK